MAPKRKVLASKGKKSPAKTGGAKSPKRLRPSARAAEAAKARSQFVDEDVLSASSSDEGEMFEEEREKSRKSRISGNLSLIKKSSKKRKAGDDSDDDDNDDDFDEDEEGDFGEKNETVEETKVRVAKEYLANLDKKIKQQRVDEGGGLDDDEFFGRGALEGEDGDDDHHFHSTADALRRQALEAKGKIHRTLASSLTQKEATVHFFNGHNQTVTCCALTADDKFGYSGSKDGVIFRWDLEAEKRVRLLPTDPKKKFGPDILSIAVNYDGNLVAFGGSDKILKVFDIRANKVVENFKGHRGAINALAFQKGENSLYSGSNDRTVKIWNLNEMCYVDSLFGHQSEVIGISSLVKERCVTVGVDRTLRLWKIPEETQLILRGHQTSIDCVSMLAEESFATGGQDGSLCLWAITKKKPIFELKNAHGADGANARWISSLAAVPSSDLLCSGSNEGILRFWRVENEGDKIGIEGVKDVDLRGFINGICLSSVSSSSPSPPFAFCAVGQEPRLGRWGREGGVRNGVALVKFE